MAMKQNSEPSVEDILASIKQVIARDTRAGFDALRREQGGADDEDAHDDQDDVLDLTEAVAETAATTEPEAPAPLLGENTRAAMRDSLAALAAISGPGAAPQIVRSGETSLESLTRELLRPALTEWLDRNLPAMVERLVAAEIARIVGKKV